jgi:hypothetical protein
VKKFLEIEAEEDQSDYESDQDDSDAEIKKTNDN